MNSMVPSLNCPEVDESIDNVSSGGINSLYYDERCHYKTLSSEKTNGHESAGDFFDDGVR